VLEVGSRGVGHIRWLAPVVQPDVAVVTNIGVVHLETFETRTSIADAKWELVASLPEQGTAVLPDDEPLLVREHPGPTVTFGTSSTASVRITNLELDDSGIPRFHLHAGGARAAVELSMAGEHQARNAAAAAAAALALGLELDDIVPGLAAATGSPWRMEVIRGRFTVVNDAYNANPDSMAAGLRTVAAIPGRSIAVLGLMAELGTVSEAEHRQIGLLARDLGFSHVFVVGEDHGIAEAAGAIAQSHPDIASADEAVRAVIEPGDVVLVKASRAAGLERIAIDLAEESVA
jgi:UDP-N-acetylmuramoyl-tripeptide--D-alanyl-D-alanine ligase